VGYYEADGFVGDFFGEGIFDGFEEVEAESGGGLTNLFGVDGVDPVGAESDFASFDEVGNKGDDGRNFSATELGDFLEGMAFFEEFAGFLRGAGGAAVPFLAGAFAVFEAAECVENGFAVVAAFGFADAGDTAEFLESFGFAVGEVFERCIVENDERGDAFLHGGGLAPLAQEFAQLFFHRRERLRPGKLSFKRRLFDGAGSAGARGRFFAGAAANAREPCGGRSADVADAATLPLHNFAKVFADIFLAAALGGDEFLHSVIALPGAIFFLRVSNLIDEEGAQGIVFLLPEEEAIGGQAVASGAAGLLIELLDAVRQPEPNHRAHIGFIDAEAEGDGADKDMNFLSHPLFLVGAAGGGIHLAVVADSGDAAFLQAIHKFANASDGGAINDDIAGGDLFYGFEDKFVLQGFPGFADDVAEVFAAEAGDGFQGIAEFELLDDVVADLLGGAGGESGDGAIGKKRAEFAELAIFGAKIVTPLRDAVGFIDGEEGDGNVSEPSFGAIHDRAFGGNVHQTVIAGDGFLFEFALIGFQDGAIQEDGRDAHLAELRDLVLHEGDQGRDDDGGAVIVEDGRELVAEGFASAGGHDDADIAAGIECADDFFLAGAEGVVAPVALERVEITRGGREFGNGGSHESSGGVGRPAEGCSLLFR
jgi:hypothetical protein